MRRVAMAVVVAVSVGATVVGATARSSAQAGTKATKLTVWGGWTSRELGVFKKIVAEYDRKHPEVTINVVGGIDATKIVAAIRGGNAADVTSSFDSTNVGNYCTSGAWLDLRPMLNKDKLSLSLF